MRFEATHSGVRNVERVPVIDMKPWYRGTAGERAAFAHSVDDACRRWGFFQILEHGVPEALVDRCHIEMRRFFALPREAKQAVRRSADNAWGYYDRELTKNVRDWKEVFDFWRAPYPDLPDHHPDNRGVEGENRWPAGLPGFRDAMLEYFAACEVLAFELLEAACTGLGLAPTHLESAFRPQHSSFLRLNHYPPGEDSTTFGAPSGSTEGALGVNRHRDAGALTILSQSNVAALQVFRAGKWSTVEPVPGALVINVGDMLQVWSNDLYRAPLHRVLANAKVGRFSAPYFFNPAYETDCAPMAELLDDAHPPRYSPVNWGEFRRKRADGDYADLGEEIQVSQFRIHAR